MNPLDVLAVVIVLLVPFNVGVSAYLLRLAYRHRDDRPSVPTLRSRALSQVVLTVVATIGGYLGLARLDGVRLSSDAFTVLIGTALLLVSVPGAHWTVTYIRGGFE